MATITKRKGKKCVSYYIRVFSGYNSSGGQIAKVMTYKPESGMTEKQIEKAVNEAAILFEKRVKDGFVLNTNIRFSEFAGKWLNDYGKTMLAPATYHFYKNLLVRINQAIGNIKLSKLQPHHLQEFYKNLNEAGVSIRETRVNAKIDLNKFLVLKHITKVKLAELSNISIKTVYAACAGNNVILKNGEAIAAALDVKIDDLFIEVKDNKRLKDKTIRHYHSAISSILQTAVQWQVIADNPAKRIKPPKVDRHEAVYLEDTEAVDIAARLLNEPIKFRMSFSLLLYAGLRRGELAGLEWKDIDFQNGLIHIVRASQYIPRVGIIQKDTKNYSSRRVLKLDKAVFDTLKEYKAWQNAERLKLGDIWHEKINIQYSNGETEEVKNDRLFTQENGNPIFPATFNFWLNEFIRKNNLKHFTPHSLRHTNVSLMIAAGVPIRTVSGRVGHSQTTTTVNMYAHAIKTADEIAAEAIGNMLRPKEIKTKSPLKID